MNDLLKKITNQGFDHLVSYPFERHPMAAELSGRFRNVSIMVNFPGQELAITGEYMKSYTDKEGEKYTRFSYLFKLGSMAYNLLKDQHPIECISSESVRVGDKVLTFADFMNLNCRQKEVKR